MNKGFFKRLIARGYKGDEIRGLFHKAIARAKTYTGPTVDDDADHNNVIFHLPFHPNDPASFHIQEAWHTHVAKPQWKMPLEYMKNPNTREKCNIKRMIISYKSGRNLNLISPPTHTILFDFKSPQAQTRPNGGQPEKLPNHFLPRQSASWPWCLGRS